MENYKFIPYSKPYYTAEEKEAVARVISSGWWTRGKVSEEFEQMFCRYTGSQYAIGLNSCTAGLHTALKICDIKNGDKVITTPMTFCATANTIVHCGAEPIFADIDSETGLIDVNEINKIMDKQKDSVKCIVAVDYAGQTCDYDKIRAVMGSCPIIEDAAHSIGGKYKGKNVGTLVDMAAFSFYATKNIATGEGGMLAINDEEKYQRAKILTLHGMSKDASERYKSEGSYEYDVIEAGYKYNITDISSAIGIVQLKRFDKMQEKRKNIRRKYDSMFNHSKHITLLKQVDWSNHSNHLYIIKLNLDTLKIDRSEFVKRMYEKGIGTSVHFKPLNTTLFYRNMLGGVKMPKAEEFYSRIISLPMYPGLSEKEIDYIVTSVLEVAQNNAK